MKQIDGTINSAKIKIEDGDKYQSVTFINCYIDNKGIGHLWAEDCMFDECEFTEVNH